MQGDKSEDENFTTDYSTTSSAEVSQRKSAEDIVVAMAMEVSTESNHNDIFGDFEIIKQEQTVAERLSHL